MGDKAANAKVHQALFEPRLLSARELALEPVVCPQSSAIHHGRR